MNTHNEHARTVDKVPQKYTVREVLDSLCFEEVDHDEDFDGFIHITSDLDGSGTKLEMSRLTTLITKVREEVRAERDREIVEWAERLKFEKDVVVCDCGEPYKESDLGDLIDEFVTHLTK